MAVKFSKFERVDSSMAEQDILCDGESVGRIERYSDYSPGCDGMQVEEYTVEMETGQCKGFLVEEYGNAREAHKAAKEYARSILG